MILCQEVELCASLRRYYPVQVVRVSILIHYIMDVTDNGGYRKMQSQPVGSPSKYLLFVQTILVLTVFVNGLFL